MSKSNIPTYDQLMNPLLTALKILGGSGSIEEINAKVAEVANLTDEQLEVLHNPEKGGITQIEYRLGWTRTYLRIFGLIENSTRGVWSLTIDGRKTDKVDPKEVVRIVRDEMRKRRKTLEEAEPEDAQEQTWQDEISKILLEMEPSAFERLTQRLLREAGFTQVEVTGRTGDGGIDGKGVMRLGGLLSFHVIFQCKRWKGSVGPGQVRDFRGAMIGRADKGLIITTGSFTREAIREASRDGAFAIDLIDGDQLIDKLKQYGLGVKTEKVELEHVTIDRNWFFNI